MRTQTWFVLIIGVVSLVLCTGYGLQAQSGGLTPEKIGVVSIMAVVNESQPMQTLQIEFQQYQLELQKLDMEFKADQAELQTMVQGSDDQLAKLKEAHVKEARMAGLQKYYEQLMQVKQAKVMSELYPRALEVINVVAEARGLTLVLEQMRLPSPLAPEAIPAVASNHKVLYSKGCVDITEEVKAALNK